MLPIPHIPVLPMGYGNAQRFLEHLGGTSLPLYAFWPIKADTPAGDYTMKLTIKDRKGKATATVTKSFEVLKKKLGFVRVVIDPPLGVVGQQATVYCTLIGYELSKKTKAPHVTFEMKILDDKGKETLKKTPFKNDIKIDRKETPGEMVFLPMGISLHKPGKYKVVLKATDKVGGKSTEETLELSVVAR